MATDLIDIACLELGPLQTNCYVVSRPGGPTCWVFDPGVGPRPLLDHLQREGLEVERIVLTHGHGDHLAGAGAVKRAYPQAIFTVPAGDEPMLADPGANLSGLFGMAITAPPADQLVRPGDRLSLGTVEWVVLDTAGHTPGGGSWHCPSAGVVIVGDALFAGGIGRFDLPGADGDRLIDNIRRHLLTLDDDTRVLSGHGPATTIGWERRTNPFL